jgi:hypothetical protein
LLVVVVVMGVGVVVLVLAVVPAAAMWRPEFKPVMAAAL